MHTINHCCMKRLTLSTMLALGVLVALGQSDIPRVYDVENTGSQLAKPVMPEPDQLPVIRELPDALEGVTVSYLSILLTLRFSPIVAIFDVNTSLTVFPDSDIDS